MCESRAFEGRLFALSLFDFLRMQRIVSVIGADDNGERMRVGRVATAGAGGHPRCSHRGRRS